MRENIKKVYKKITISAQAEERIKQEIIKQEKNMDSDIEESIVFNMEFEKKNTGVKKGFKKDFIIAAIIFFIIFVGAGALFINNKTSLKDKRGKEENKKAELELYNGYISCMEFEASGSEDSRNIVITESSVIENIEEIIYNAADSLEETNSEYSKNPLEYSISITRKEVEDDTVVEKNDIIEFYRNYFVVNSKAYLLTDYEKTVEKIEKEIKDYITVEKNLEIITTFSEASNPEEYIKNHEKECENIVSLGEKALNYMLYEFERGNGDGLRGAVMKELCIRLLGDKYNVEDVSYSTAQEWYEKLDKTFMGIRYMPEFILHSDNKIEKLAFRAACEYNQEVLKDFYKERAKEYFTAVYPNVVDYNEEDGKLNIFAYVNSIRMKCYNGILHEEMRETLPVLIVYTKEENGEYIFTDYKELQEAIGEEELEEFEKNFESIIPDLLLRYTRDYSLNIKGIFLENVYYPWNIIKENEYIQYAEAGYYDDDNEKDVFLLCRDINSDEGTIRLSFGNGITADVDSEYEIEGIESVQRGDIDSDGELEILIYEKYTVLADLNDTIKVLRQKKNVPKKYILSTEYYKRK